MLTHTPTKGDLFWEPLKSGLCIGILGYFFGLGLGIFLQAPWSDCIRTGVIFGAGSAFIAGGLCWVMWLDLVWRSYIAKPPMPKPVEEIPPEDGEIEDLVASEDGTTVHVIKRLPIPPQTLKHFVTELANDGKPTYQWMVNDTHLFIEKNYRQFVDWMIQYGYALPGDPRKPITFTARGIELFHDIRIDVAWPYSPINFENMTKRQKIAKIGNFEA